MRLLCILFIFALTACTKPTHESIRKPQYDFHWDPVTLKGRCINDAGVEGYNPRFIGPCGDLRGFKFSMRNLDGADLRGAVLDGMNFSEFSFNGANLMAIKARGTSFSEAQFNGAKLMHGQLHGANFDSAQMSGVDMSFSKLSGASFIGSSLHGAHFENADLSGALFPSHLDTAQLQDAQYSYGTVLPFGADIIKSRKMHDKNMLNLTNAEKQNVEASQQRSLASIDEAEEVKEETKDTPKAPGDKKTKN